MSPQSNVVYLPPANAASVLVLRPAGNDVASPDIEVLVARRKPELRAFGGFWVFPGGAANNPQEAMPFTAARELLEETGLEVKSIGEIRPWARWITPSTAPRRFDTYFFVTRAPENQVPRPDGTEIDSLMWIKPQDWAMGQCAEEYPIAHPTECLLREVVEELQKRGSLEKLLHGALYRAMLPVMPKIIGTDTRIVVMPWDPEYVDLPGDTLAWQAEEIATRAGWPSRMPVRGQGPR